jgi:Na+/melibiose symporter-like transporter
MSSSDSITPPSGARQISLSTKLFYGVGAIANGVKGNAFNYFMLFFYSQVVGVEGALVGLAMLIMMIADAFSDPIVGHISDNWHSKWGRRHPFMYFSAVPTAILFFLLFTPPTSMGQGVTIAYFLVISISIRTSITLFEIPSSSLVPEFTDDYDQRTSIMAYRYFFGWWGGLTIAVVAYKVFFASTDEFLDGRLNPDSWIAYGLFGSTIIFLSIMVSSLGTHKEIPYLKKPTVRHDFKLKRTFDDMFESLSNRNFLIVFCSAIVGAMAGGINTSLVLYFNTFFWEFTSSQIGTLNFAYYFSAITALVLAPRLTRNREKQHVAVRVYFIGAMLLPLPIILRLLGLFPGNDSEWLLPIMMIHGYIDVTVMIMAGVLIGSMIADIVEDSQKTTGRRSEGLFFAGQSFAGKVVNGFGVFATGIILSIIGFPKGVAPGEVPQSILNNLAYIYVPLVIVFYSGAVYILSRYKITRDGHANNLRAVDALAKSGSKASDNPAE